MNHFPISIHEFQNEKDYLNYYNECEHFQDFEVFLKKESMTHRYSKL